MKTSGWSPSWQEKGWIPTEVITHCLVLREEVLWYTENLLQAFYLVFYLIEANLLAQRSLSVSLSVRQIYPCLICCFPIYQFVSFSFCADLSSVLCLRASHIHQIWNKSGEDWGDECVRRVLWAQPLCLFRKEGPANKWRGIPGRPHSDNNCHPLLL